MVGRTKERVNGTKEGQGQRCGHTSRRGPKLTIVRKEGSVITMDKPTSMLFNNRWSKELLFKRRGDPVDHPDWENSGTKNWRSNRQPPFEPLARRTFRERQGKGT
jgi:hypothetical protein